MRLTSGTFDARLNAHAQRLLKTHETLLRDKVRNAAFYEALKRTVKPGDSVLDIGAGTGIWAIVAATLGAKRVVAIDADEMMIGVIKLLAAEHNVADRIEAIWGHSFDVKLDREFDVVVSETLGYVGYDENIVAVMQDARSRFLKAGGAMIPETVSLHAAAGHLKVRQTAIPEGVPFEFRELATLTLNAPRVLKRRSDFNLLTKATRLISTDLRTADTRPPLENLKAVWDVPRDAPVNSVVVWVESRLTRGVRMTTRRTTSWLPTIFSVGSVNESYDRLEFTLSLTPDNSAWSVKWVNADEDVAREYSLAIAVETMIAAARESSEKHDICLRDVTAEAREVSYQVYAGMRAGEVATLGWPDAQADAFLRWQFDMRERAHAMRFPDAVHSAIVFDGRHAGRMIVDHGDTTITLVDIAVLPAYRRRGIASHLLRELQHQATAGRKSVVLHVAKNNASAVGVFRRHAFAVTAETDLDYELTWKPR